MILNNTQLWNNNQEILQVQLQTGIVHVHWSEFYITIYSFLGNSENFLHTAVFHAVWVIGMEVTLDWLIHKPKTNAYFCAIHASEKVVKMKKTILMKIFVLGKKKKKKKPSSL